MTDLPSGETSSSPSAFEWGRSRTLDAFETVMWRMDRYPNMRSAVVCVVLLDQRPDDVRLRAAHEWGSRAVPRLRERIVGVPLGRPEWVRDGDFSLDAHLQFVEAGPEASIRALLDLAASFAMEPFDHTHSPWSARVINGLEGGQAGYVLKLHHALSDGIGIVQLLTFMFSRRRSPGNRQAEAPVLPGARPANPLRLLAGQVQRELLAMPDRLDKQWRTGGHLVQLRRGALRTRVSQLAAYGASLRRALAPEMATPSPLLSRRSNDWRYEVLEFPLPDFKAAAKACGATLNDAFVAGLLGGFARYHQEMGVAIDAMPLSIPISIRAADATGGGNHFVPGQLVGPLADCSPLERMHRIGEQVKRLRDEPALGAPLMMMPLIAALPKDAVAKVMGPKVASNDLQCSNVPGIREDVYLAGAKATRVFPFAPLPGVPAMITLMTHGTTCCVGMNLDSGAVSEPERWVRCVRESFDEIIESYSRTHRPDRRTLV